MEDSIPFEIMEHLDGDGAALAWACFIKSIAFVHHLMTFIDIFYLEMSNAAGFKPRKRKVFSDLRDARQGSSCSGIARCCWVYLGTLQAHVVMKRFLAQLQARPGAQCHPDAIHFEEKTSGHNNDDAGWSQH
jgi:hypothetical protein